MFVSKNNIKMNKIKKSIQGKYNTNWVSLLNSNKINNLTTSVSNQLNHYSDKPQGLWLAIGDSWIDFIESEGMTGFINKYCSAFKIDLKDHRLIILSSVKDYINFNKKYAKNEDKIRWEEVSKEYDGIIVHNPKGMSFKLNMFWLYTWDITSACIWRDEAIKSVEEIYNDYEPKVFG